MFNDKEKKLLENADIQIEEGKKYSMEEIDRFKIKIGEHIISHSSKEISDLEMQYSDIVEKIEKMFIN